ncbi:MAG: mechanosensitive ion channel protein, partial [Bacteroidetes bacterium SW_11_45_7]
MKRFLFLISPLICLLSLLANEAASQDSVNLSSPSRTIATYTKHIGGDQYELSLAGKCFNTGDQDKNESLAWELKQVLDAKGLVLRPAELPSDSAYLDTVTQKHHYVIFPEELPQISLQRQNGRWYFSEETVKAVPKLHNTIFPFGSDFLVNIFPESSQKKFLGLRLWQYFGFICIIALSLLIYFGLLHLLTYLVHRYSSLFETKREYAILRSIIKPFSGFLILFLIRFLLPVLQLSASLNLYFVTTFDVLQPLIAVLAVYRSIDMCDLYLKGLAEKTESTLDDQLVPLLRKILKVVVIIIGGLFILQNLNFNITTWLTGISIGGLAFALAAQDTIKNFFGSLMIFVDRPFQIGDWINFDGTDGTVEEVGFRSTRVRTFANSVVSIPNGRIADMKVDNLGLRKYRRFYTEIALPFHTPPHLIEAYIEGLRDYVRQQPNTRKDFFEIHLNSMTDHS